MKKNVLIILTLLFVSSCGPKLSPSVYIGNMSNQNLISVKVDWNSKYSILSHNIIPGGGGSYNFWVKGSSDFFGPVHIEWENAAGKKFTQDFVFKKEELPSIDKKNLYNRVMLYFTQDSLEYYSSDNLDFNKIEKERAALSNKYFNEYKEKNKRKVK